VMGTCGWLQGNIVDKSEVREIKKKDDGKGSGTEVITFEAHQDYCIMICESSTVRNSLMVGVLIVQVDGKIVYDMRPESDFGADNAKFLENHTFYDGNDAQLPDPTMEALSHNGVGNTPYYRNVFTMVARDINLSQYGERIPIYRFVMVGQGEQIETEVTELVPPHYARFTNADWPLADPESHYLYSGRRQYLSGGAEQTFAADTIQEVIDYFNALGWDGNASDLSVYIGYSASSGNQPNGMGLNRSTTQLDVEDNTSVLLIYTEFEPTEYFAETAGGGCTVFPYVSPGLPEWYALGDGRVGQMRKGNEPFDPKLTAFNNCTSYPSEGGYFPRVIGTQPLFIQAIRSGSPPEPVAGDPCLLGQPVLLPDAPGFVINCAGEVFPEPTYAVFGAVSVWVLQLEATATVDSRAIYTKYTLGPVRVNSDPGVAGDWTPAYDAAVLAGTMAPGLVYGVDYPVSAPANSVYEATYTTTDLNTESVGLDTVITRIAIRGGLTADDIDVTEMDQEVLGYMITQNYIGTDCIRPLMTAFISYASEYDAKIRFHKHGEVATMVVDAQDIIQGTEESDKNTREQQVEFPKTYSITYIDATQNYAARPQVDRRTSSDVRAIGEMQTQVPVVLPPDYARQLANIGMKVNWARAMGSREFSVPYAGYDVYLEMVAGKPFGMDSQRRIASEISLEDGEISFKGLYDRQSAYTSDITATPALPPTPPPSNIGGVTLFAAMNLPVLRDQDDVVGLYFAVGGLLAGWPGCSLQVSSDDQVSWQTAIASMTEQSTIGYLTTPLALAPAEGTDVTNTLSVAVHGGELNTITYLQFLNEGNPCAIVKPGDTGECEILSFLDADETAVGEYDLTTLSRGGLATAPAAHAQGARFTSLDSVYFWQVPSAWIGRTIWFRPVTFGTNPDSNAVYSIVFQPAVSQTEWSPGALEYTDDGTTITATATPRHRLGNDLTPIASINFIGYRWIATDGTVTQTVDTTGPVQTFTIADFSGPITISVSQLNRITGPGPALEVIIP
jgi:hypothetical protein